jgi:hypothetical protein
MEAVCTSETIVVYTSKRLHGAVSYKTVIFIDIAVRTLNLNFISVSTRTHHLSLSHMNAIQTS